GGRAPSLAFDPTGKFVVTCAGPYTSEILARRFDAAGTPLGAPFQVNTYTTGTQDSPRVAVSAAGDFVIAWKETNGEDGDGDGVYAQQFNAADQPQGGEFRVNTYTTGAQANPAVAMDAAGDFLVAWHSYPQPYTNAYGQDGSGTGIFS